MNGARHEQGDFTSVSSGSVTLILLISVESRAEPVSAKILVFWFTRNVFMAYWAAQNARLKSIEQSLRIEELAMSLDCDLFEKRQRRNARERGKREIILPEVPGWSFARRTQASNL